MTPTILLCEFQVPAELYREASMLALLRSDDLSQIVCDGLTRFIEEER